MFAAECLNASYMTTAYIIDIGGGVVPYHTSSTQGEGQDLRDDAGHEGSGTISQLKPKPS